MRGVWVTLVSTLLVTMGIDPTFSEGRRLHVQTPDTYTLDPGVQTTPAMLQLGNIQDMVQNVYQDIGLQVPLTDGSLRNINNFADTGDGIGALLSLGVGAPLFQPLALYSQMHVPLGDPLAKSLFSSRHPFIQSAGVGVGDTLASSLLLNRLAQSYTPLQQTSYLPLTETLNSAVNQVSHPLSTSYPVAQATLGETFTNHLPYNRFSLPLALSLATTQPTTVGLGESAAVNHLTPPLTSLYGSNNLLSSLAQINPASLYGSQGYSQLGQMQSSLYYGGLPTVLTHPQVFGGLDNQISVPISPAVYSPSMSLGYSPLTSTLVR